MRTEGAAPQYPVGAVDRTLLALDLLAERRDVRLTEIREHLGVGQSTAHRLMAMLLYRGFAVQDPTTRAYSAGPSLVNLSRSPANAHDSLVLARPELEWLASESGETVHLGVLAGVNVRYLDVIESRSALRVTGRVGRLTPAHATSLGKAMLATFDDATIISMYTETSPSWVTERTVTDVSRLHAELCRTRARGWARNREEMENGVCSVGAAFVPAGRGVLSAISIATPKARLTAALEKQHAELLRQACARLSRPVSETSSSF